MGFKVATWLACYRLRNRHRTKNGRNGRRPVFWGGGGPKWLTNGQANGRTAKMERSSAYPATCPAILEPPPPLDKWLLAFSPAISRPFLVLDRFPMPYQASQVVILRGKRLLRRILRRGVSRRLRLESMSPNRHVPYSYAHGLDCTARRSLEGWKCPCTSGGQIRGAKMSKTALIDLCAPTWAHQNCANLCGFGSDLYRSLKNHISLIKDRQRTAMLLR